MQTGRSTRDGSGFKAGVGCGITGSGGGRATISAGSAGSTAAASQQNSVDDAGALDVLDVALTKAHSSGLGADETFAALLRALVPPLTPKANATTRLGRC